MKENYNFHIARTTLQNYMQLRHPGIKEVRRHHHPAQIRLAAVRRNEMSKHIDEHYCLTSVKSVKTSDINWICAVGAVYINLNLRIYC